jgi:hypothetical protein
VQINKQKIRISSFEANVIPLMFQDDPIHLKVWATTLKNPGYAIGFLNTQPPLSKA